MYFFLEAEFIGVIQILVYVGAITILFAFSIMLTRRYIMKKEGDSDE
ncbi:MAG: NADH-quinone oxidoreductase subunit J [Thermoplasmata archaeon]|nr:NADH-quinone oxidoreductase subunit J [Thermoplasmata archaeon]